MRNSPTTYQERLILEELCVLENDALRYGLKMKNMPEAVRLAAKLGISL